MKQQSWVATIAFACFSVAIVGCPEKSSPPTSPTASEASRPPLRVLIQSDANLHEAIERRWQTISEQRLQIDSVNIEDWLENPLKKADVLIFESRWLATLAEQEHVVPLPGELIRLSAEDRQESERSATDTSWPWVWRQSVSYGQRVWGIPLGAPMFVWLEAENSILNEAARSSEHEKASASEPEIAESMRNEWLVDRFLVLAAELNPRPGESSMLFQMNNGRSRLNEPWVTEAAKRFALVAVADDSPTAAWNASVPTAPRAMLGWPSLDKADKKQALSRTIRAPKPWVDAGRGLIAVLTKHNRQSTTSVRFLRWLDEDTQRSLMAEVDLRVQRLPDLGMSVSLPLDAQQYLDLLAIGVSDRRARCELQFAAAAPYRTRLGQALREIIENSDQVSSALADCHRDWNKMSDKSGVDRMKRRLGFAYGLDMIAEK